MENEHLRATRGRPGVACAVTVDEFYISLSTKEVTKTEWTPPPATARIAPPSSLNIINPSPQLRTPPRTTGERSEIPIRWANTPERLGAGLVRIEGSGRGAGHSPESRRFRKSKLEPSVVASGWICVRSPSDCCSPAGHTSVVGECYDCDGAALRIECEINAADVRSGALENEARRQASEFRISLAHSRRRWSDVPFQGLAPE